MQMKDSRRLFAAAVALVIGVGLSGAEAAVAGDWEWTLIPYVWASDVSLDVNVDGDPLIGEDVSFSDLVDKVDFASQLHFEGQRGKGGLFFDLSYFEFSDSETLTGGGIPPLLDGTLVETKEKDSFLEVGGFYRPKGSSHGLDVLFGVRIINVDQKIDITLPFLVDPTRVRIDDSFTDGFVGLRYSGPIGENWGFSARGDVSAGGTELTWNTVLLFGYQFGQTGKYSLLFGYRQMEIELEENDGDVKVETDIGLSGPIAGLSIKF